MIIHSPARSNAGPLRLRWLRLSLIGAISALSLWLGWLAGTDGKRDAFMAMAPYLVFGGAALASVGMLFVVARAHWLGIALVAGWVALILGYGAAPSRYHSTGTITLEIDAPPTTIAFPATCVTGDPGSDRVIWLSGSGEASADRIDIAVGLPSSAQDQRDGSGPEGFRILIDVAPDNGTNINTLGFIWAAELEYGRESSLAREVISTDTQQLTGQIRLTAVPLRIYEVDSQRVSPPERWPALLNGRLSWSCDRLRSF